MKFDASIVAFLSKDDWRVLTAVEMGSRNHEVVPIPLIRKISGVRSNSGVSACIANLAKVKAIAHKNNKYDGYSLTFIGYDCLALHALTKNGSIDSIGPKIACGKEADIYMAQQDGANVCLKIHREGRTSFRSVKSKRDYLRKNQTCGSWWYLSRLAAKKEFAFLQLFSLNGLTTGITVPKPLSISRHIIVMEYIDAIPLRRVSSLSNPISVASDLLEMIVRFAEVGFIHGDFNEFNLLIDENEKITIIDLPQIVSVAHPNAKQLFDRDVECVLEWFNKKFGINIVERPEFDTSCSNIENASAVKGADGGRRCIPIIPEGVAEDLLIQLPEHDLCSVHSDEESGSLSEEDTENEEIPPDFEIIESY